MIHTLSDTVLFKNLWQFPSILLQPFPIAIPLCVSSAIIKLCVSFIVPHATWTGVSLTPSIMRINCPESLNNYCYLFKNSYVFKEKKKEWVEWRFSWLINLLCLLWASYLMHRLTHIDPLLGGWAGGCCTIKTPPPPPVRLSITAPHGHPSLTGWWEEGTTALSSTSLWPF